MALSAQLKVRIPRKQLRRLRRHGNRLQKTDSDILRDALEAELTRLETPVRDPFARRDLALAEAGR